ncbi:MAG: DNA-binding response OmpR family regulator [Parasphingorhabdus sp.]|jgi:DNA-binding response OmpR family regulator
MRIALLEDDPAQAEVLIHWLENAEHSCHHFNSGEYFLDTIYRESYDLILLDWQLPDISGDKVLSHLRKNIDWPIPVIFITNRDREEDIVFALKTGADDYMSKPVKREELLARIDALARRSSLVNESRDTLTFAPYTINIKNRSIFLETEEIFLSKKEFELASFLFKNSDKLVSRRHLLEAVWGTRSDLATRTIDTHISKIRRKLNISPENGWRINAVYQHGYRLEQLKNNDVNIPTMSKSATESEN